MNIKEDLKIDKTALDEEWERQAELINEYTTALADKQRELELAKLAHEIHCANKKQEIRTFGEIVLNGKKIKITENALAERITADGDLVEEEKEIISLENEVDVLKGAVEAIRSKKSALEWESQLYMVGYFGEPKTNPIQTRVRG